MRLKDIKNAEFRRRKIIKDKSEKYFDINEYES